MFTRRWIFVFLVLIYFDLSFETHCSGNATTALSRLQEKFLCNLEYEERPVKNKSTLTEIEIGFFPVYITVMDDKPVTKVSGYLFMKWIDEFKNWNPKDYDSITELPADIFSIWYPKLTINEFNDDGRNDFLEEINSYSHRNLSVKYDGTVTLKINMVLHGPCTYELSLWSYDIWDCEINVARQWDEENMVIIRQNNTSMNLFRLKKDDEWQCTEISYPVDVKNSERFELYIKCKRHVTSYIQIYIMPGLIFLIFSIVPFMLSLKISYRLLIHFTTTFIQIFYMQYLYQLLSNNTAKFFKIDCIYVSGMYINFIGICIASLNSLFCTSPYDPPKSIINFVEALLHIPYIGACFSFLMSKDIEKPLSNFDMEDECIISTSNSKKYNENWLVFFGFLDKFIFCILLAYICIIFILEI